MGNNFGAYSAGFVLNVIVNGIMQHVTVDGRVELPFNSEYKLRLQNKNNRRAVAKVFIDDENVSGGGFVINAYSHVDIETSPDKGYKFKFVSLDSGQAADAGKSTNHNGEKGVIRVEFSLEKETYRPRHYDAWTKAFPPANVGLVSNHLSDAGSMMSYNGEEKTCGGILSSYNAPTKRNLAGCTVSGDKSNQAFSSVYVDLDNQPPVVLTLVLKGIEERKLPPVDNSCVYCTSCGKKANRHRDKYCSSCGTRL